MNSNADFTLEQFVWQFFETQGAEIEKKSEGLDVLLPEHLAERLAVSEFLHLETGPNATGKHAVNYGTRMLENMVDAACEALPLVDCQLHFDYLKSQGFDHLIRRQIRLNGAVGRVENIATVKAEYLLLACRYLAQSDEQKEDLITLIFNLETGAAVPDMDRLLFTVERTFQTDAQPVSWQDSQIGTIINWINHHVHKALGEDIRLFQESMNRKFHRDVTSLVEYYASLKAEMEASLQRPGLSDQLIRDRKEKISLIPDELEKKKDDLYKKYSIDVKIKLCGAILIRTPAVKILYRLAIGRKQKRLTLFYNPVTKSLDPPTCQGCGDSSFSIGFCNQQHILCPVCKAECPICRKNQK